MATTSIEFKQPGASAQMSGSSGIQQQPNKRLNETQAQVDQVIDIMRDNVEKVLDRDQKLSDLEYRSDSLQAGAQQFEQTTGRLKRKYWWKNLKMLIILIVVILVIIAIIIVVIVTSVKN